MDSPKTMTVPEAGRVYFSLGRNASYEAARRGDIPTIKIGRLLRVPVVQLERARGGKEVTSWKTIRHGAKRWNARAALGSLEKQST